MVNGIHHITAISGDPQKTLDFYSGFMGLRFIKKTVNFDDPYTYHLYLGNSTGDPGTIITFFPWGTGASRGRRGSGQVTTISYSAAAAGMDFWLKRFKEKEVEYTGPFTRFNDEVILFEDPDGIENELCFNKTDNRTGWGNKIIPEEFAIKGFEGATLTVALREESENMLVKVLGFKKVDEVVNRIRYNAGETGGNIDLLVYPEALFGGIGVGAVHHIAFRTENDETQIELRNKLNDASANVTPVIDRNYFKSIYFREPGNVLFEIATDQPGFLIDETLEDLGTHLKLPEWYEQIRNDIESKLPKINIPEKAGR